MASYGTNPDYALGKNFSIEAACLLSPSENSHWVNFPSAPTVKLPEQSCTVFLVPAHMTKNGTDQLIVLNKAARRAIDSQRGVHKEWVFTHLGKRILRMNNNGWRTAWKRALLPADGHFL